MSDHSAARLAAAMAMIDATDHSSRRELRLNHTDHYFVYQHLIVSMSKSGYSRSTSLMIDMNVVCWSELTPPPPTQNHQEWFIFIQNSDFHLIVVTHESESSSPVNG